MIKLLHIIRNLKHVISTRKKNLTNVLEVGNIHKKLFYFVCYVTTFKENSNNSKLLKDLILKLLLAYIKSGDSIGSHITYGVD